MELVLRGMTCNEAALADCDLYHLLEREEGKKGGGGKGGGCFATQDLSIFHNPLVLLLLSRAHAMLFGK